MDNNITKYDVIIAGSGAAGLYAAINLDPSLRVLVISKKSLTLNNSFLAQGGIAAVTDLINDDFKLHFEDTMIAGQQANNREAVDVLVHEAHEHIRKIIDLGVEFNRTESGESYHRTLEGGHSRARILHHYDSTGREITSHLLEKVQTLENVTVIENAMLCDIKKEGYTFYADVLGEGEKHSYFCSSFFIMATGGIGRVYGFTTNSAIATGDGIALAHRMGAVVKNISFVQFHPTAFVSQNHRERFLISEAVRGEGAYLLNCDKQRFMHNYDERLELAPRDVVSQSIMKESARTNSTSFYLDISHKDPEFLKERFPMIYQNLLKEGIDMTTEPIPIFPCQHYLMGGIDVSLNSESSIGNMYAVGECSHTGVHGKNRLASNSLLEALVFSARCAKDINAKKDTVPSPDDTLQPFKLPTGTTPLIKGMRTELREIMQKCSFVVPNKEAAIEGYKRACEIRNFIRNSDFKVDFAYCEALNLATIATLILSEVIDR